LCGLFVTIYNYYRMTTILNLNNNGMMMNERPFGYCDLHNEEVWELEFERKGCWNCYHFGYSADSPYIDVQEAAQLLKKSPSTIRRWLKNGRLEGKLFIRKRPVFQTGSPRKWFIEGESIKPITPEKKRDLRSFFRF